MTQEERARIIEARRAEMQERERQNTPKVEELSKALQAAGIHPIKTNLRACTVLVRYDDFDKGVEIQNSINNGALVARRA